MFVASKPFVEHLILSVEDRVAPNTDEVLGTCTIPLQYGTEVNLRSINTRWFDLEKHVIIDGVKTKVKLASKIHMRVCLEGGYQLIQALLTTQSTEQSGSELENDIDNLMPLWNDSISWKVFDPRFPSDKSLGKILPPWHQFLDQKIRGAHFLLGIVAGERFAIELTPSTFPQRHFARDMFPQRHVAGEKVGMLLGKASNVVVLLINHSETRSELFYCAEPPLGKEVVEFMLDAGSHMWSTRRSKANFLRIMSALDGLIAVGKWCPQVLIYIFFVLCPEMILPIIFIYLCGYGVWCYRWRPKNPPHMDTCISFADNPLPDELDEEFDTFPTSRPDNIIRMRYDRLRSISGRIQTVIGDLATQCERLESLLSWRDPRATWLFVIFCLIASIVLFVTPFTIVVRITGLVVLIKRLPWYRHHLPSLPLNFFRRLPTRTDCML
ncbi:FT-interacting protein 1-like protein [Tanacetum coccineum]